MFRGDVPLAAFVSRGARAHDSGPYTFSADDVVEASIEPALEGKQLITHLTAPGGERKRAIDVLMESVRSSSGNGLCIGMAEAAGEGFELTNLHNGMVYPQTGAIIAPERSGHVDDPTSWSEGLPPRCRRAAAAPLFCCHAFTHRAALLLPRFHTRCLTSAAPPLLPHLCCQAAACSSTPSTPTRASTTC